MRLKAPEIRDALATELVETIQRLRTLDLRKSPSIGETLDWAQALVVLGADSLDRELIDADAQRHRQVRPRRDEGARRRSGSTAVPTPRPRHRTTTPTGTTTSH